MLTTLFPSLILISTLFYFTTIKMKYLTMLTTLFFFITIKMKYLTALTKLFFFHWLHSLRCFTSLLLNGNLWLRSLRCFSSLITLTTLFYLLLLKWNIYCAVLLHWLRSLRCLSSLLLKWNLWLHSLHCFSSLLLTLAITLPSLRCSYPLSNKEFFPRNFQCFHKICMYHSNFTVRKFSGVLHALLSSEACKTTPKFLK